MAEALTPAPPGGRNELRFALMLNGGVSLAIWIGGVVNELVRVARASTSDPGGVYASLLSLTQSAARVDVMAGASAGGINGALAAQALVYDNDLDLLRDVWVNEGAFLKLLRSPLDKDPPSIMKGDEFLLPQLQSAITGIGQGRSRRPIDERPIHLIMTTTIFEGQPREFADDYGSVIRDETYRGEFVFRRGVNQGDDWDVSPDGGDGPKYKIDERLALAARSTASFPFAFEPTLVPLTDEDAEVAHPNMKGNTNFTRTTYAMDGGVLVNTPIHSLLEAINAQPAHDERVRRVIAYVVPDPGLPEDVERAGVEQPPMTKVATSIVSLPRVESVVEDLDTIRNTNRAVVVARAVREQLVTTIAPSRQRISELSQALFAQYAALRREEWLDTMIESAALHGSEDRWDGAQQRRRWRAALSRAFDEMVLGLEEPYAFASVWDINALERTANVLIRLLRIGVFRSRSQSELQPFADARQDVHAARADIYEIRQELRARHRSLSLLYSDDEAALDAWAVSIVQDELAFRQGRLRSVLVRLSSNAYSLRALADRAEEPSAGRVLDVDEQLARLLWPGDRTDPEADNLAAAMVEADDVLPTIVQFALIEHMLVNHAIPAAGEKLEVVQVSGYTPNTLDDRRTAEKKLAGIQLGHFGGFYKASWRANDWMWGRLDGAFRIVQVLLRPVYVKQSLLREFDSPARAADALVQRIRDIAMTEGSATEVPAGAGTAPGYDPLDVEREARALFSDAEPPDELTACVRAVARRLQVEILSRELVSVAKAVALDAQGEAEAPAAALFRQRTLEATDPSGLAVPPARVADLFGLCKVGEEHIQDEAGGDRFTQTLGRTIATTTSAIQSSRSGIRFLKPFTIPLRGFGLSLYALILAASRRSRMAWALSMLILTTGGALVVIASLGPTSFHVAGLIGAVVILAGLVVMAIKVFKPRVIAIIVLIAGLSLAIAVVPPFLIQRGGDGTDPTPGSHASLVCGTNPCDGDGGGADATDTDIRWLFLVLGVVTGTTIIGSMSRRASGGFVVIGAIAALGGLYWLWRILDLDATHVYAAIAGVAAGIVVTSAGTIVLARLGRASRDRVVPPPA